MTIEITKIYETFVMRVVAKLKGYSAAIGAVSAVISGVLLGRWGYGAGGIGGAVAFSIMGLIWGGMVAIELPNSILIAFGTFKRLTILLGLLAACIVVTILFSSVSFGLLLFIMSYLYLIYLRWRTMSLR